MGRRFKPVKDASAFRKIAAAMWNNPTDPTIFGSLDVDASHALAFIKAYGEERGTRVTVSHLVACAIARTIGKHPEVNAKVRFWGRLEQRTTVDIVVQVATDGGRDLSTARIARADEKSLADIAEEVARQAKKIRSGDDAHYGKSRSLFERMPWWLARPAVRASDLLMNELHIDLPKHGMPVDPFGSAMITNVGMFGIDTAFAPFTPIARCPMLILVTEVRDRPWVVDGELAIRPVLRICATFDHRVIDGFHAGQLSRDLHRLLSAPEELA